MDGQCKCGLEVEGTVRRGVANPSCLYPHLHECSERIRILSLDLLDRVVALFLAATREDHVIASLAQMLRYFVSEPRVRARYDDYLPRHCF